MPKPHQPAIEPIVFMIKKQSVLENDTSFAFEKLTAISSNPDQAMEFCGRMMLIFDGWEADPRELFEIDEVRAYLKQLDAAWPYWYFFLSQADESLKLLESCLCDTIEVAPGVNSIDVEQFEQSMIRHFAALEKYGAAISCPAARIREITEGIVSLFRNAHVDQFGEDDNYR